MDRGECSSKLFELVERYYALLYRYAYRLAGSEADAEDLTQHAFLIAQTKLDQLRDEARARPWLCTIVRNAYLKDLRTKGCLPLAALDQVAEPASPAACESDFDQEQLQNVLNDLPEEFRSPVILFYFEEFSYKEIAEHMGVPLGTIMSRLARAKAYLRHRLTEPETVSVHRESAHSESVQASLQEESVPQDAQAPAATQSWQQTSRRSISRHDESSRDEIHR